MGGVADVLRDLPAAIARQGFDVSVVTPSYGTLHKLEGSEHQTTLEATFAGSVQRFDVYAIGSGPVTQVILDHALFAPTDPGIIYHDDGAVRPYAADASKFAFLGAAAAAWIRSLEPEPAIVHLHDWHAAFYLLCREFDPAAEKLRSIRTVFSIHNLAYQGQRPFRGDPSSLAEWFPDLTVDESLLVDPHIDDCINPMAFAIRAADTVNTVSPTYAREICRPSAPERGFFGGEGLEEDLSAIALESRLSGILNGCEYPVKRNPIPGWQRIVSVLKKQAEEWLAAAPEGSPQRAVHELALERIAAMPKRRPLHLMTSVGRLVSQKASLMLEPVGQAASALDAILEALASRGVFILTGSGEPGLEAALFEVARRHENFVFLNGYSESVAGPLYRGGDLFLMPSSFEPCGISQMLAMRDGQPCVVHGVGGLSDTVTDNETGFVFHGATPAGQAEAFVQCVLHALEERARDPVKWAGLVQRAEQQRFDWDRAARLYVRQVYELI